MNRTLSRFLFLAVLCTCVMPTYGQAEEKTCIFPDIFWVEHQDVWPAPFTPDETIANLRFSAVLQTPSAGSPWFVLAHQWIPAQLNVANGAVSECLGAALEEAKNLLELGDFTENPDNLSKYLVLAGFLADYNRGILEGCAGCGDAAVVEHPNFAPQQCPPCCCPKPKCDCKCVCKAPKKCHKAHKHHRHHRHHKHHKHRKHHRHHRHHKHPKCNETGSSS